MPQADQIKWTYPDAEELQGKTIRIENTGLDQIFMTLITDAHTGEGIGNITRIQLDIDINGPLSHIAAIVTIHPNLRDRFEDSYQITLENPQVVIDAAVNEVKQEPPPLQGNVSEQFV